MKNVFIMPSAPGADGRADEVRFILPRPRRIFHRLVKAQCKFSWRAGGEVKPPDEFESQWALQELKRCRRVISLACLANMLSCVSEGGVEIQRLSAGNGFEESAFKVVVGSAGILPMPAGSLCFGLCLRYSPYHAADSGRAPGPRQHHVR